MNMLNQFAQSSLRSDIPFPTPYKQAHFCTFADDLKGAKEYGISPMYVFSCREITPCILRIIQETGRLVNILLFAEIFPSSLSAIGGLEQASPSYLGGPQHSIRIYAKRKVESKMQKRA